MKINTLRSFITLAVSTTVAVALMGSGICIYSKSAETLKTNYKKDITRQLYQINSQVENQIDIIDSVYPLLMSNNLIREYLDPASNSYHTKTALEKRLEIERQVSYILISTYLWNEKFINSVYLFEENGDYSRVTLYDNNPNELERIQNIYQQISREDTTLQIKTLDHDDHSIYFVRNIKSTYTGKQIATIILDINQDAWKQSYSSNTDDNWLICMFNGDMQVFSHVKEENAASVPALMDKAAAGTGLFQEPTIDNIPYFMASRQIGTSGIVSAVAVPKQYLLKELNQILSTFLIIFTVIILITLIFTIFLSRFITAPIEKMIQHIKYIADGSRLNEKKPPTSLYSEFNDLANAFQAMLTQLDVYYNDIYQKQLLLKNAEIKALQSQMDPHFLFNVLDTVAWKAQMCQNEEIYQMIISLGELLRSNILSKEKDFVSLEEELTYVRFYIYLQQTRFEDKFTAEIQGDLKSKDVLIPRFSIQPLVENAVVHGLEPKPGFGKLVVNIIEQEEMIEINVVDNGMGFPPNIDLEQISSSGTDSHTHIGLRNLNKRLMLLYGETCRLSIVSIPEKFTSISFRIPKERGTKDDISFNDC